MGDLRGERHRCTARASRMRAAGLAWALCATAGCTYPRNVEYDPGDAATAGDRVTAPDRVDATTPVDALADVVDATAPDAPVDAPLDARDAPFDAGDVRDAPFDAGDVRDATDVVDATVDVRDASDVGDASDATGDRVDAACTPGSPSLTTDPRNCGVCGNVCESPYTRCDDGVCNEGDFPPSDAGTQVVLAGPHTYRRFEVPAGVAVRVRDGNGTSALVIRVLEAAVIRGTLDVGGANGVDATTGTGACGTAAAAVAGGGAGGWTGGTMRPLPTGRGCDVRAGFVFDVPVTQWAPGGDGTLHDFRIADAGGRTSAARGGGRCGGNGGNVGGGGGGGRRGSGGGGGGGPAGGGGGGAAYWGTDLSVVLEGQGGDGGRASTTQEFGRGGRADCIADQSTCNGVGGEGGALGGGGNMFDGRPGVRGGIVTRGALRGSAGGGGGGSIGFLAWQDRGGTRWQLPGSAGGGGGGAGDPCPSDSMAFGPGGGGGGAGGALVLSSNVSIVVAGNADISADGGDGGDGAMVSNSGGGGGGGGSGGLIRLAAPEIVVDAMAMIHAAGGRGGRGASNGGDGGAGGPGRVALVFDNASPCRVASAAFRDRGFDTSNPCATAETPSGTNVYVGRR